MSEPLLRVCSVTKNFPGVQALKGVDFELYPGEVHCLIGANGAGKSTLIKILSGVYRKDSGKIIHKGREVEISSPKEARKLGIATVFQELDVVPYLSIAENVFLGDYPRRRGVIDYKEMLFKAQTLLKALGEEDIDPILTYCRSQYSCKAVGSHCESIST
jgi:ABC-type sugar transport system ATPase subunit